ncbi:MAG: hypothetical protein ACREHG_00920, partial [Candidatus Saccharimonadales bacterium]
PQVAIYDIVYNCGSLTHWPKLRACIQQNLWKCAAEQSHRPQVSESRNKDIKELFLSAAA